MHMKEVSKPSQPWPKTCVSLNTKFDKHELTMFSKDNLLSNPGQIPLKKTPFNFPEFNKSGLIYRISNQIIVFITILETPPRLKLGWWNFETQLLFNSKL